MEVEAAISNPSRLRACDLILVLPKPRGDRLPSKDNVIADIQMSSSSGFKKGNGQGFSVLATRKPTVSLRLPDSPLYL